MNNWVEKYLTKKNMAILLALYVLKKLVFLGFMFWVGDSFQIDPWTILASSVLILGIAAWYAHSKKKELFKSVQADKKK